MNGITVETVASSWIDALGGLSQIYMCIVPPAFCAEAETGSTNEENSTSDATKLGLQSIGHLPEHACARLAQDGEAGAVLLSAAMLRACGVLSNWESPIAIHGRCDGRDLLRERTASGQGLRTAATAEAAIDCTLPWQATSWSQNW